MTFPRRRPGQSQEEFYAAFMGDAGVVSAFPDPAARAAACSVHARRPLRDEKQLDLCIHAAVTSGGLSKGVGDVPEVEAVISLLLQPATTHYQSIVQEAIRDLLSRLLGLEDGLPGDLVDPLLLAGEEEEDLEEELLLALLLLIEGRFQTPLSAPIIRTAVIASQRLLVAGADSLDVILSAASPRVALATQTAVADLALMLRARFEARR